MNRIQKAIMQQEVRVEMAQKYGVDLDYHKGYLAGLKDIHNGDIDFGSKLSKVMSDKCIKQNELAKAVNQSRQSISFNCINGVKNNTKRVRAIAEFLDVSVEEILEK